MLEAGSVTGIDLELPLALGGAGILMNQHGFATDAEAVAVVDAALASGVRLFDTAPAYGNRLSERRLGLALEGRADVTVATKTGLFDRTGGAYEVDFSGDATKRSLDASRIALRRDRLDVVYLHELTAASWAEALGPGGAAEVLAELRATGEVRSIGVTGSSTACLLRAARTGLFDAVMVWRRWTLLDSSAEPLLVEANARGLEVLVAAPYASGILATGAGVPATVHYREPKAEELERVTALEREAAAAGLTLAEHAVRFALDARVTALVIAADSVEQARQNAALVRAAARASLHGRPG